MPGEKYQDSKTTIEGRPCHSEHEAGLGLEAMVADPWGHRSEAMRCATCMWFVAKAPPVQVLVDAMRGPRILVGRCRRHAPTMNGYPVVLRNDWCGDHKLDEGKV